MKKPRYKGEIITEATTLFSKLMGKPNDGMDDLLSAMDNGIKKIGSQSMMKKMDDIDNKWDNLWKDIVNLAKEITKG